MRFRAAVSPQDHPVIICLLNPIFCLHKKQKVTEMIIQLVDPLANVFSRPGDSMGCVFERPYHPEIICLQNPIFCLQKPPEGGQKIVQSLDPFANVFSRPGDLMGCVSEWLYPYKIAQ